MKDQNISDFSNLSLEDKKKILKNRKLLLMYCIELAVASKVPYPEDIAIQFYDLIMTGKPEL